MIGQLIGNYRIIGKIGQGGMGVVYEAQHQQMGRRAAIKLLHPQVIQRAETVTRFLNEARASSKVQHPGMVNIFEFGCLPNGSPFMIMEFLHGEPFTKRLRGTPGYVPELMRLLRQVASVLAAAHQEGVIHRDLKPDNIMIVQDPETAYGERVKVLDFGVAKILEENGIPGGSLQTQSGVVLGTPAYMSPEQCRGGGNIDSKSDVYSLGLVLYQVLAGVLPFRARGFGELLAQHMFSPHPPLAPIVPQAPPGLIALVDRMLAKKPEERPSMLEVAAALDEVCGFQKTTFSGPAVRVPGLGELPASAASETVVAVSLPQPSTLAGVTAHPSYVVQRPGYYRIPLVLATMGVLLAGWLVLRRPTVTRSAAPGANKANPTTNLAPEKAPAATKQYPPETVSATNPSTETNAQPWSKPSVKTNAGANGDANTQPTKDTTTVTPQKTRTSLRQSAKTSLKLSPKVPPKPLPNGKIRSPGKQQSTGKPTSPNGSPTAKEESDVPLVR